MRNFAETCAAFALAIAACGPASAAPFADPLETPARISALALQAPVNALAAVDADHVVAVGPRGHILRSADRGKTWRQQPAPVGVDLLAVQFPAPALGWAAGHDGVVLRSRDGGVSWQRVLDGRRLGAMMVSYYEKKAAAGDSASAKALQDAKRMAADGPTRPFFAIHFRDEREGWLVGQFNLVLHTTDGGATWEPWLDRTDNPDAYSLHAIHAVGNEIFIVGELGLVLRLDAAAGRFARVRTPYPGSWFGFAARGDVIVAVGLRGSAWRSSDGGANWKALHSGTSAAINSAIFLADGRLVLATHLGELLVSDDLGERFTALPRTAAQPSVHDIGVMEPGWLLVAGPRGVQRVALPAATGDAR